LNSVSQGVGAEAAEDDAMDGADAGAGQHADGQLGDHREIQADTVAFFYSQPFENIGEFADFLVHLLIGDGPVFAGFVAFPLDRDLVGPGLEILVEAVVGNVQLPAFEELHVDIALLDIEVVVHDLVEGLEPFHILFGNL